MTEARRYSSFLVGMMTSRVNMMGQTSELLLLKSKEDVRTFRLVAISSSGTDNFSQVWELASD